MKKLICVGAALATVAGIGYLAYRGYKAIKAEQEALFDDGCECGDSECLCKCHGHPNEPTDEVVETEPNDRKDDVDAVNENQSVEDAVSE